MSGVHALRRLVFGRPLAASFGTSGGIQILNVITGVLLARVLGPEDRGGLAAVILWPSILATVGSLGMAEAATYHAARREVPLSAVVGGSLLIAMVQSAVLVAIGIPLLHVVLANYPADTLGAAYLYLAFIPVGLPAIYLSSILNGLHQFRAFNTLRFLVIGVAAGGLALLALSGTLTVRSAVGTYLVGHVVTLGVTVAFLWPHLDGLPTTSRDVTRRLLGFGVRSHISTVSASLNERFDQLVISVFLQPATLGLYVVAVTLTSLSSLVGTSVSLVALPAVARLRAKEDQRRATQRYVAITFAVSAALTVPLILLAPNIIEFAFGREYLDGAPVSRVLLIAGIVLATGRVLGAVLKAVDRPLDAGLGELLALAVTVLSLAVFLPAFGLLGAGLASLLAYCAATGYMARQVMRALGQPRHPPTRC